MLGWGSLVWLGLVRFGCWSLESKLKAGFGNGIGFSQYG